MLWILQVDIRPSKTEKLTEREMYWLTKDRQTPSGSGSSWAANSWIWESHMSLPRFTCFPETGDRDRWPFGLRRYGHSHVHRRPLTWGTRALLLWTDRLPKEQSALFTAGYQEPLFEWPSRMNQAWVNDLKMWNSDCHFQSSCRAVELLRVLETWCQERFESLWDGGLLNASVDFMACVWRLPGCLCHCGAAGNNSTASQSAPSTNLCLCLPFNSQISSD